MAWKEIRRGSQGKGAARIARCALMLSILVGLPRELTAYPVCGWSLVDVGFVCTFFGTDSVCETTFYYSWECVDSGGNSTPGAPPTGGTPTTPPQEPPRDANNNGKVDDWLNVVRTVDKQAGCVRKGERLGTDFGGVNTFRPQHPGVDIQCDRGDPAYSAFNGTIIAAGWLNDSCGYGVDVKLSSTITTRYCHLNSAPTVTVGQTVKAGSPIGECGTSGESTGDHVHVSYWNTGTGQRFEFWDFVDRGPDEFERDSCVEREIYKEWR